MELTNGNIASLSCFSGRSQDLCHGGGLVYLYSGSCFVFLCVLAAVKDKFAEVAQDILLVWAQVYASLGFSQFEIRYLQVRANYPLVWAQVSASLGPGIRQSVHLFPLVWIQVSVNLVSASLGPRICQSGFPLVQAQVISIRCLGFCQSRHRYPLSGFPLVQAQVSLVWVSANLGTDIHCLCFRQSRHRYPLSGFPLQSRHRYSLSGFPLVQAQVSVVWVSAIIQAQVSVGWVSVSLSPDIRLSGCPQVWAQVSACLGSGIRSSWSEPRYPLVWSQGIKIS